MNYTLIDIAPDHPHIHYTGRVDHTDPAAPRFAFPGVAIRMGFTGRAVAMRLRDFGSAAQPNYYYALVDDAAPVKIATHAAQEEYILAANLPAGPHQVTVFKLTEASPNGVPHGGMAVFLGFRIEKDARTLPARVPPHRVEFIGDSITCGYGNEERVSDAAIAAHPEAYGYTTDKSNAYLAWGSAAARALDAEYVAVAYSGKGLVRNFAGHPGPTVPQLYDRILPEWDEPRWDPTRFVPELVVINLGTNDFSEGLNAASGELDALRAAFRKAYVAFLEKLRAYYPRAQLVVAIGPMVSDAYPPGYAAWTHLQEDAAWVVQTRVQAGDGAVGLLKLLPQSAPYGQDYHPTVATHAAMARRLVDWVRNHGGL